MSDGAAGLLQALLLVAALAVCYRPMGDYMARVFEGKKHLAVERAGYRLMGVDPDADQTWRVYLRGVLAFSAVSVLFLYAFQRLQAHLPLSLGFPDVRPDTAWNTAASFVTNTNWQSYSGESTMGHLVQMAGLAVQNFASAAVGVAVAVDLVRTNVRILLPLAILGTVVLVCAGVVQNLHAPHTITTLAGGHQTITGGPVASQESIKELGTNGGGFYNANSAHPFENPNPFSNWFENFFLLLIPFSLPRTFGRLVKDNRQGYAIVAVMSLIWIASTVGITAFELAHHGAAPMAAHAAMEGKEVRIGVPGSAMFASSTTLTSTGAVNSFHDSFTPLGGGITIADMMTGEITPGGVGSGLYGILVIAIISVFVAGLMVGRTPEYLGKKIRAREIKLASLYILATPACVLVGTGIAMALPGERAGMLNSGPHGLSEVLYAFTSAANNNGSAFAGITVSTVWYNTALGLVMLFARLLPIVFVLALAGSLSRQSTVPVTAGTLPTHRPQFVGLVIGVIVIVVALTYFPAIALGPLAEGVH
jgi:K+-transporting ATPase ATPase A chain